MTSAAAQPRPCSVARTLDIVGEKWALLAIREVFLGNRRFDEMVRRTGAPRDTLAARPLTTPPGSSTTSPRPAGTCSR
jgi:DNA-binding HxlR family transcriptional regulator